MKYKRFLLIISAVFFLSACSSLRTTDDTMLSTNNSKAPKPTSGTSENPSSTPIPEPTPTGTAGEVGFSENDRFLTEAKDIELFINNIKSGEIHYTLDGSTPTKNSTRYTEPIQLVPSENDDVSKVNIISAKAFYDDGSESEVFVHTYFLNENINNRYTTYVMSIVGDPNGLFSEKNGIFAAGNRLKKGRSYERMVSIEWINSDGTEVLSQFGGLRIHGGKTREYYIPSLRLYARKEYGKGKFNFDGFGTPTYDREDIVSKYDKLILDSDGDDFNGALLRDEVAMRLASKCGLENYEEVVPVTVYLNGEYYALYWLHEMYCDDYFQKKAGKGEGEYVVCEGADSYKNVSSKDDLEAQAAKEFNAMASKYFKKDLTDDTLYNDLCELIDIENYLTFIAFNAYFSNTDWPMRNNFAYKYYPAEGEEYGSYDKDGKWRFLIHDLDCSMGRFNPKSTYLRADFDDLKALRTPGKDYYAPLFASLMKRQDCKDQFIKILNHLMDIALNPTVFNKTVDELCALRDSELPYYLAVLKPHPSKTNYGNFTSRDDDVTLLKRWAEYRAGFMKEFIEDLRKS